MAGVMRALLGVFLILLPGAAIVWAFFSRMDWAKQVVLAVVFALTVVPGFLFLANLFLAWPVTLRRSLVVIVAVTVAAFALGAFDRYWAARRERSGAILKQP